MHGIWNVFKPTVLFFTGVTKLIDSSLTAISQRRDNTTGMVTVLVEDVVEANAPELLKAVRYLERLPDVAEYLLYDLARHQEKVCG